MQIGMLEMLPPSQGLTEEYFLPLGNRYDGIVAVLGRNLSASIRQQSYFLVYGRLSIKYLIFPSLLRHRSGLVR